MNIKKYIARQKLKKLQREVNRFILYRLELDSFLFDILENYNSWIEQLLKKLNQDELQQKFTTERYLFGILRPISEFDRLSQDKELYNAAFAAEDYLSRHFKL